MASITRRDWAALKVEFIRAARGINYSGWKDTDGRAEYLLYEAYLDICTLYHHKELEEKGRVSLTTGQHTAAYPTTAHLLFLVAEIDSDDLPTLFLEGIHVGHWSGIFMPSEQGQPRQYGTFGRSIFFDRKVEVPRAYHLFHQRRPADPDFGSSATPEIAPHWDHHLIEMALVKAGIRNSDPALAALNEQMLRNYLTQQAQPLLLASTAPVSSNRPTVDDLQSGKAT